MNQTISSVRLASSSQLGPLVSEHLMGVNLELTPDVVAALSDNRIRNPKFGGSPDPQTGIAREWQPFGLNMGGMHARLLEGMFMSSSQSQFIHNYTQPYGAGIVQTGISIRAGEDLEFRIWAKCRHRPVRLGIALRAEPKRAEDGYANAQIVVDSAYWKCFRVKLSITTTDRNAVLFIFLEETGIVLIDQVVLEPVGSSGVDPDTEEAILRLNPSAIRFPGGCMSTNHHWRFGTGPRELRPSLADPVFKMRTDYEFGTDEYLSLCRSLGISPHITLNIGSGTPKDSSEWARYCRDWFVRHDGKIPPAYFQIGNEQYGSWETSHMNAAMYVNALKEFVPGIREAYPESRIIALAEPFASGIAGEPDTPLRELVLTEGRGLFDVLAINRYKGQWFDEPEEQLRNAVESVEKICHDLEGLAEECRKNGWKPRLALTEWNYWLHAAHWDGKGFHEPDDALHGMFFSGVIHSLMRMADVIELASYYHLLNAMGLVIAERDRVVETGVGGLFRLYRSALPGRLRAVCLEGRSTIDVVAIARDEGVTALFLRNGHRSEPEWITLPDEIGQAISVSTLAAADCQLPMREVPNSMVEGSIQLPPLSVTRIDLPTQAG